MSREMERMVGTSEEEEEEDDEMEMGVKEEEGDGEGDSDEGAMVVGDQNPQRTQQQIGRRSRPREEKERTKLRERHRRAITARILAGLRRHGNYNLRVRADINDVIAALAREAGWNARPAGGSPSPMTPSTSSPAMALPLKGVSSPGARGSCPMKGVYVPPTTSSAASYDAPSLFRTTASSHLMGVRGCGDDSSPFGGCVDGVDGKQAIDVVPRMLERDFAGTPYVPVYVMLPLGVINMKCELVDPDGLLKQLGVLKSINVDGVMVDCWWGIVEAHAPQKYNWNGYKRLFQIVRELKLKLQVYFDYMRNFRVEFDEFFEDGTISEIEVGLGPCGELRYPSYPVKHGWRYPGIGEFQCYDQYLLNSLRKAAEVRGHSLWGRGPENAGSYNSQPHETGFFCDGGDYDSYYGRFFLGWYSQSLVDHADRVLSLAKLAFEGTSIAAKVSGIHWWYKTASHAAELTAGFYNPCNRDGYSSIAAMLKKHSAALNFTCVELRTLDQHEGFPEALADPEGLVWQVN
ncbi:Beta-amylase 7 [Acorus calamus]|uniref:Beta-amylase n=1 Tax=Acorus calamus TaxID=4465 RepID=A0AAV9EKM7_ACOCL|nr:Beta-amylase 7 [Acorus calamus]